MCTQRDSALVGMIVMACLVALLARGAPRSEFRTIPVSTAPKAQDSPTAVLKEDGTLYVAWHDIRLGNGGIYAQRYDPNGTAVWHAGGRPLVVREHRQRWMRAVDDGLDGVVMVWAGTGSPALGLYAQLYAQRFDAQAVRRWQPGGAPVCLGRSFKNNHTMIPDGHGGYYVVWEDWRRYSLDVYGQWIDASGGAQWAEDGLPICDSSGHQYEPSVVASEDGPLVSWWSVDGEERRVHAQRIARDGRLLWGEDGVQGALVEANQLGPVLAYDGQGGAFLAWADARHDDGTFSNLDVYAQHFGPDGRRVWGNSGRVICDAAGAQQQVAIVADGRGGFYLAWKDARDIFDDIYMQHVQADGSNAWPLNGLPVCVEDGRQREPQLAAAGGHVWIAWFDYRREPVFETSADIYIQRASDDGSLLYEQGGLALGTQAGEGGSFALTATGPHVAVTWVDLRRREADMHVAMRDVPDG